MWTQKFCSSYTLNYDLFVQNKHTLEKSYSDSSEEIEDGEDRQEEQEAKGELAVARLKKGSFAEPRVRAVQNPQAPKEPHKGPQNGHNA